MSAGYRLPTHDGDRDGLAATSTGQSRHNNHTEHESQYALSPVLVRGILDRVLANKYDYALPSSTATTSDGRHQATVSGSSTEKPHQCHPISALQDYESDEGSESSISNAGDDSQPETSSPLSEQDYGRRTLSYDQSRNIAYASTSDDCDEECDGTDNGSRDDDYGDDHDDDGSGHDGGSGFSDRLCQRVDDPQEPDQPSQSAEQFEASQLNDARPVTSDAETQEPPAHTTVQAAASARDGAAHAGTSAPKSTEIKDDPVKEPTSEETLLNGISDGSDAMPQEAATLA